MSTVLSANPFLPGANYVYLQQAREVGTSSPSVGVYSFLEQNSNDIGIRSEALGLRHPPCVLFFLFSFFFFFPFFTSI